jgi:hypothetical protein
VDSQRVVTEDDNVAKFSLRRYDVQAQASVVLSAVSLVFLIGLVVLIIPRLDPEMKIVVYSRKSLRMPLIYLAGLGALGLGLAGLGLGYNSAGQRRNDKPAFSWIGFFVGAFTVTVSLILLFLFKSWGEALAG